MKRSRKRRTPHMPHQPLIIRNIRARRLLHGSQLRQRRRMDPFPRKVHESHGLLDVERVREGAEVDDGVAGWVRRVEVYAASAEGVQEDEGAVADCADGGFVGSDVRGGEEVGEDLLLGGVALDYGGADAGVEVGGGRLGGEV